MNIKSDIIEFYDSGKENGQWKMIAHHTDLLPHLEKDLQNE